MTIYRQPIRTQHQKQVVVLAQPSGQRATKEADVFLRVVDAFGKRVGARLVVLHEDHNYSAQLRSSLAQNDSETVLAIHFHSTFVSHTVVAGIPSIFLCETSPPSPSLLNFSGCVWPITFSQMHALFSVLRRDSFRMNFEHHDHYVERFLGDAIYASA